MRRTLDKYYTPEGATHILIDQLELGPVSEKRGISVLECCSGLGHITDVLKKRIPNIHLITNDIDKDVPADFHLDAKDPKSWEHWKEIDWVITNPPFPGLEIVQNAIATARIGVAMLLRLSFIDPVSTRADWLTKHAPDYLYVLSRISFTGDGHTDSVTVAWFVWMNILVPQKIKIFDLHSYKFNVTL